MKRVVILLAVLGFCGFAAAQAPPLGQMDIVQKSVPDGPVAKVGSHIIDREEFIRFYDNELEHIMAVNKKDDLPDGARAELALRCVGLLIERQLLYDEARKRKVTVPAENMEKAWQAQLAQTQKLIKAKEGKDVTEQDVLTRIGYTKREEVLADLERALVTEKMRGIVMREAGITVSDEDVQKEFDKSKETFDQPARIHLQQIYIDPKNIPGNVADKDKRAREKAEQALDRVAAGQSFEGVARAVSDAPDAKTGGDMGMLPVQAFPPFMIKAATALKPGQMSEVIQSEFGFHVVKLIGMEGPRAATQAEAAPEVRQRLLAKRGMEAVHDFCDKLVKSGIEVEVYLELEKNLVLNGAIPDRATKKTDTSPKKQDTAPKE